MIFRIYDPPTHYIYTLSLHDALPIFDCMAKKFSFPMASMISQKTLFIWCWRAPLTPPKECVGSAFLLSPSTCPRSEEHTSELQSRGHLVCRLLLEKKK